MPSLSQLLSVCLYKYTYVLKVQFSLVTLVNLDQFSTLILTFLSDSRDAFKIKTFRKNYASNKCKGTSQVTRLVSTAPNAFDKL